MANTVISLRSSGVSSNTPSLGVLANGELSLNFADGILYYKTAANALGSIQTTQPSGLNTEIQFNDSGSFGANSSLTFNKTTGILSTNNLTANSVATTSYIQFNDGSKQFTANAGSTVLAQAAFDKANTDATNISATAGVYGNATHVPVITLAANGRISGVVNTAISASDASDYFPTDIDWGYNGDTMFSVFGELIIPSYDCRVDPITPQGYILTKSFGFLT